MHFVQPTGYRRLVPFEWALGSLVRQRHNKCHFNRHNNFINRPWQKRNWDTSLHSAQGTIAHRGKQVHLMLMQMPSHESKLQMEYAKVHLLGINSRNNRERKHLSLRVTLVVVNMSPIHSVKETTRILTELDPQEKDQLQESVLVTVATTLTKYRSPSKYVSSQNGLAQGNIETDDSCDADESQDESQYTEDEYGDDEEDTAEEEDPLSRGPSCSRCDSKKTCCLCQCHYCQAARAEEEDEKKFKGEGKKQAEASAGKATPVDKRVQVHSCQVQTSGAVTEYRPLLLHSPCK